VYTVLKCVDWSALQNRDCASCRRENFALYAHSPKTRRPKVQTMSRERERERERERNCVRVDAVSPKSRRQCYRICGNVTSGGLPVTRRNADMRLQSIREHAPSLTSPLIGARYSKNAENNGAERSKTSTQAYRDARLSKWDDSLSANDSRVMNGEICAPDRTFATLKLPASAFSEFRFTRIAPTPRASYSRVLRVLRTTLMSDTRDAESRL